MTFGPSVRTESQTDTPENSMPLAPKVSVAEAETSSSAMAERPRELDQRFQVGVNLRLNYRSKGYFSRHCDMTQFTLTHHTVNKPFILLGLAAKYLSLIHI